MLSLPRQEKQVLSRANKVLGKKILEFFTENFDLGGSEPQKSFVPWKARKYQVNHKILNDTGKLRGSFRIERNTENQIVVVNTADYADFVNAERPILYSSQEIEAMVTKDLTAALTKLFNF